MSYYRDSPSKVSPYNRSPIRVLPSERDYIEEQIHLKAGIRAEVDNRRLLDQISLLQIKLRKTDDLQLKCENLIKQISALTRENEELNHELHERKYENERYRANISQIQERQAIKSGQVSEINHSLELEIDLLKKERIESNKLYESHIQKLEYMLQDKIKELDVLNIRYNDVMNSKQIDLIKYEEQKNKLKNTIGRIQHDMQRQIEYIKQKQMTQKMVEIEGLKKNYNSQILLLEDQLNKIKINNNYKNNQFQGQLADNKALKNRYEEELRTLALENDTLRERMLKLQQLNRSEVQSIQGKYCDIHFKGTTDLKQQHNNEIKILLEQIDKLQWLLNQKNNEIQNLIKQKRQQRIQSDQRELILNTDIETIKNKLKLQIQKNNQQNHQNFNKINTLSNKLLSQSQHYHQRAINFSKKINDLQAQIKYKQNCIDNSNTETQIKFKQYARNIDDLKNHLQKINRQLLQCQNQKNHILELSQINKNKLQKQNLNLSKKVSELLVKQQLLQKQIAGNNQDADNNTQLYQLQINSLKENINLLQKKLNQEEKKHSNEMNELSNNLNKHIQELIKTQKRTLQQIQQTHNQELQALNKRISKLQRDIDSKQNTLSNYIEMYNKLQKYFLEPHDGALFDEKSNNSIFEVLSKTNKSTIHIF